jgi:glycosyltransferase involved in cell wall biosynthesis
VLLLATRWMFRRVVFQFHAGGLSELVARLPAPLRALCRLVYGTPDLALLLSEFNPPDGAYFGARRSRVVPYGIEDVAGGRGDPRRARPRPPRILYVGALRESKGCLVLLDACQLLGARGVDFELRLVGEPESRAFAARLAAALARPGLAGRAQALGLRTAEAKWEEYEAASVFCFPTFYEAESFGLVLLEAMQFGLPVVATRWRGVPSVVQDGDTGFLVPPRDAAALASALARPLSDAALAERLGARGRERFLERFTLARYLRDIEDALLAVSAQAD